MRTLIGRSSDKARSPFTQKYEPGSVTDHVPVSDNQKLKLVEQTVWYF